MVQQIRRENHRLKGAKTTVNNGISTTGSSTGEFAGFLVTINSICDTETILFVNSRGDL